MEPVYRPRGRAWAIGCAVWLVIVTILWIATGLQIWSP